MNNHRHTFNHSKALKYMRAGKAIMTIESKKTQKHFTYRFKTPKDLDENTPIKDIPVWVSVLTGPDNELGYEYVGVIFGNKYYHSRKARVGQDAKSIVAFKYWFKALVANDTKRLSMIELYHEGTCMRCGRKLTTPESVELGVGPVCGAEIDRLEMNRNKKIRQALEIAGEKPTDKDIQTLKNFM